MDYCKCLIHPFQNDPGVSQRQRVMDELLSGATKIDARTLADLLDYFVQMSGHINYYDLEMKIGNWQPFFRNSTPFTLAAIIKYRAEEIEKSFQLYQALFEKKPSASGLQLNIRFLYFHFIHKINNWHLTLKDSRLPMESGLEMLIRDKLQPKVKEFIGYANAAVAAYGVKRIDFLRLYENKIWNISQNELYHNNNSFSGKKNNHKRLTDLNQALKNFFPSFLGFIKILSAQAEKNLELSLIHKKEELQQMHQPHLALVFAFLNIFRHLQDDLNQYTKRHLDFFYKDILQLKSAGAVPDRAHVLFEIQAQLKKYMLKKGLLLKGGKDGNKQEMLFGLDDEIVVNKTELAETRTLFLNNQTINEQAFVEGVYIATDATKADGKDKEFQGDIRNFPTVGAKLSKYTDPETKIIQPYANARLGFVIASPVLYLQGGTRKIVLKLACQLKDSVCAELGQEITALSSNCCNPQAEDDTKEKDIYPDFLQAHKIYAAVKSTIGKKYIYLSEGILQSALKKGFRKEIIDQVRDKFLVQEKTIDPCYCETKKYKSEVSIFWNDWAPFINALVTDAAQKEILNDLFSPLKIFKLYFSGEKEWIIPEADDYTISMGALNANGRFVLTIETTLEVDQPAVDFYNKEKLKEEIGVTDPALKIEMDDRIKMYFPVPQKNPSEGNKCCEQDDSCCLLHENDQELQVISFYHFFRNIDVIKKAGAAADVDDETKIRVEVCGLNKFIVQNDEGLQDVKAPVYPFGARPDIIDYNVVNPSQTYYITQQLITDLTPTITVGTRTTLQGLIAVQPRYYIGITEKDLDDFLVATIANAADRTKIKNALKDPTKNYSNQVLIGPNFYLGSDEIFCKNWQNLWININWKEKPNSFNDYYKAYVLRQNGASKVYGLNEQDFQINLAVLDEGVWLLEQNPANTNNRVSLNTRTNHFNRELFKDDRIATVLNNCVPANPVQQVIEVKSNFFNHSKVFKSCKGLTEYTADSRNGFMRITLENQDFLHKEYAFVLARQMMALGRLPDVALEGAIYIEHPSNNIITFKGSIILINEILNDIIAIENLSDTARSDTEAIIANLAVAQDPTGAGGGTITAAELANIVAAIVNIVTTNSTMQLETDIDQLLIKIQLLQSLFSFFDLTGKVLKPLEVPIPNEPYTPVIKDLFLDYTASADINDIALIHLYPFTNTYKQEEITLEPGLLPTHCNEGNLFLGLRGLEPGNNLNILFQLAEATADSESEKEEVYWHYLDANTWKPLRKGFEVLDDATENLTTSGILKFAIPENISVNNTIMPKELHWIRASIAKNSKAVGETTGIHPQAIQVIFTDAAENDKMRLAQPLPAGSISKLNVADASVKTVKQPYESFGGQLPGGEGQFYVRVSELLRHKGRAIQPWDYERLALEAFPQLYKAKCISHSFALDAHRYKNDFPYAPGYVMLAVIPDLFKLKAGNSFEPKVPVSIIEKIEYFIRKRISPFVRFRVMNPRYEKVNFCIKVQLIRGKDENYYREKLRLDLQEFLAPWAVGEYHKLSFGQCIYRSDIVRFLETRDYVDFITDLRMGSSSDTPDDKTLSVCPATPRSILIGGDIEVCIDRAECQQWSDFEACGDKIISACNNQPELFIDYCNKPK